MRITLLAIIMFAASLSQFAQAGVITYTVSDATNNAGASIGHGLYTFGKNGTGNASYSIKSSETFLTIDDAGTSDVSDDSATLIGNAFNGTYTAEINLIFTGFQETMNYKQEQGKAYQGNEALYDIDNVRAAFGNGDVDFFDTIAGTIEINNTIYNIATCVDCPNSNDPFGFQFGDGASAKNATVFGGSAWIGVGPNFDKVSHWDLNLNFTEVPSPSTFLIFGLGLLGMAARFARAPSTVR